MNLNNLLVKYKVKADINMLLDMWNESHRKYHNLEHLEDLSEMITKDHLNHKIDNKVFEELMLTALFHDIVYNPIATDNEEKSAEFFHSLCMEKNNDSIIKIKEAILDTKTHTGTNDLSILFNKYDMNIVERNYENLLTWEEKIRNEYSMVDNKTYKEKRIKFLESIMDEYLLNSNNLSKLVEYVKYTY